METTTEQDTITLRVSDLTQGCFLDISKTATIEDVFQKAKESGMSVDKLYYKGVLLNKSKTLADYNITHTGAMLIFRTIVTVQDADLLTTTEVVIEPDQTFNDLLGLYFKTAERAHRERSSLTYQKNEVRLCDVIGAKEISEGSHITLKTGVYRVFIEDKTEELFKNLSDRVTSSIRKIDSNRISIELHDSHILDNIKNKLSAATHKEIISDYKFYINTKALFDTGPIWLYRINDGDTIEIKKSEESINCFYTCYNCKKEVKLKKFDKVLCDGCFGRILYKKKGKKSFVYDCR
eukprot:GAHX01002027.1.p1 GENE.GAHX01002027.1~~GAHX01002027.1.p1  ORF type:complete len:293 (+),score=62.89 GAHX01002027.1:388-1266(+)